VGCVCSVPYRAVCTEPSSGWNMVPPFMVHRRQKSWQVGNAGVRRGYSAYRTCNGTALPTLAQRVSGRLDIPRHIRDIRAMPKVVGGEHGDSSEHDAHSRGRRKVGHKVYILVVGAGKRLIGQECSPSHGMPTPTIDLRVVVGRTHAAPPHESCPSFEPSIHSSSEGSESQGALPAGRGSLYVPDKRWDAQREWFGSHSPL
jgi:hypothetical protein